MSARQRMSTTILLLALFGLGFLVNDFTRAADPAGKNPAVKQDRVIVDLPESRIQSKLKQQEKLFSVADTEPKKTDDAKKDDAKKSDAPKTGAKKNQVPKHDPDDYRSGIDWPEPRVVTPGKTNSDAPSDAIVLFNGENLDEWVGGKNWKVKDGVATADKGSIRTKKSFGDIQLHIEWASPSVVKGEGQGRGNSGVYIMGLYEVQILDSYENKTYFDGQAGSLYKQTPPLVNACRKPGEWQAYDILFTAPKFDKEGKVTKKATATVLHNGVVVQNHFELPGGTFYHKPPEYEAHAEKLPLRLQYHNDPVRFRNIWVREL